MFFGYDEEVFPLRVSKLVSDKHVNLLLVSENINNHYICIKNMSRLIHNVTKTQHQHYLCPYCLQYQNSKEAHEKHVEDCKTHGPQRIEMPKHTILKFANYQKQLPAPIVVYGDFESVIGKDGVHTACSFGYFIQSSIPSIPSSTKPFIYIGLDAAAVFLLHMQKVSLNVTDAVKEGSKAMFLTAVDHQAITAQTVCHICEQSLGNDKVRDHDHFTGEFRGWRIMSVI